MHFCKYTLTQLLRILPLYCSLKSLLLLRRYFRRQFFWFPELTICEIGSFFQDISISASLRTTNSNEHSKRVNIPTNTRIPRTQSRILLAVPKRNTIMKPGILGKKAKFKRILTLPSSFQLNKMGFS